MEDAEMNAFTWRSRRRIASFIGADLIPAAPVSAQELDTSLGVEPVALLQDGRIVVRNGEEALVRALRVAADAVTLGGCRQGVSGGQDVAARAAGLTDEDWQGFVRETLFDAQWRLSAFEAVAGIVAEAGAANGSAPDALDRARAAWTAGADDAVAQRRRDGRLTYRDGEQALDRCPGRNAEPCIGRPARMRPETAGRVGVRLGKGRCGGVSPAHGHDPETHARAAE